MGPSLLGLLFTMFLIEIHGSLPYLYDVMIRL